MNKLLHLLPFFLFFPCLFSAQAQEEGFDFTTQIRPVLDKHCFSCHNVGKVAGGINLQKYESEGSLIEDGEIWLQVIKQVQTGQMPPSDKPTPTAEEHDIIVKGINRILINSLAENNPGRVTIRRLSHNEYQYTILDLVGVEFDAKNLFPADGSGGGGFDNFSRTLFVTPLKFERYYEAAETILQKAYENPALWKKIVPFQYEQHWWEEAANWWMATIYDENEYDPVNSPVAAAEKVIYPFASKAFRRFLKNEDKKNLISLFQKVYDGMTDTANPERFNLSIVETLKAVMISPNFLYRLEEESPYEGPFALSDFELASRLSYFLWSSMPDEELFQVAYREDLHNPRVLNAQVSRMLKDPKASRFAESFVTQWLGISKLKESSPVDPEKFPEFTPGLRQAMYQQTVDFFNHCMTERKTFLDLLESDYTFLNEKLATHYGIQGVKGDAMRKVYLNENLRGGVLGMGSVLASTSLPLRTSPVLRGKWVLEEILGTPPPPPPPDVAELPEEANTGELSFRDLLAVHRDNPACMSCHIKMDPIGLGLENFDAIGRWRATYEKDSIDASGVLASGEPFKGPVELKQILLDKKESFARNLSEKMFTYAIGRSVQFVDEPTLQNLQKSLMENNFNPERFIKELVNSYAFRYKMNDYSKKLSES